MKSEQIFLIKKTREVKIVGPAFLISFHPVSAIARRNSMWVGETNKEKKILLGDFFLFERLQRGKDKYIFVVTYFPRDFLKYLIGAQSTHTPYHDTERIAYTRQPTHLVFTFFCVFMC